MYLQLIVDDDNFTILNIHDFIERLRKLIEINHIRIVYCKNSYIAYIDIYIDLKNYPLYNSSRYNKKDVII